MPEERSPLRSFEGDHHRRSGDFGWPDFNLQNVLIFLLLLALVVSGLYIFRPGLFKGVKIGRPATGAAQKQEPKPDAKASGYSAVFLVNDQIYFGRLQDANSDYPKLTEVYYLRVQSPLQPAPATQSAQPDVQLIKLGNELHGPVDEIKFNRDQILYIEELRNDSRIVSAINEYKNRNR